jgi:hypothetical protein
LLRYDVLIGSFLGILVTSLACHPQKTSVPDDLVSLFPDAAKAFGPFSISLEKSRARHVLSEARIKLHEADGHQIVTLQLKMVHSEEQVSLSFLPRKSLMRSQGAKDARGEPDLEILSESTRLRARMIGRGTVQSARDDSVNDPDGSISEDSGRASSCRQPSAWERDSAASQSEHPTPSLHDAAELFHLPLPISIREASALTVQGAGPGWSLIDGALVWPSKSEAAAGIDLSWTRNRVAELRFPWLTEAQTQNYKARRIDQDGTQAIFVSWRDGFVWIAEQDFQADSWLELQYEVPGHRSEFLLPQMPLFASMKTLVLQPNCLREQFMLENNHLSWSCSPEDGPLWAASYQFRQLPGAIDFQDWPELAAHSPYSVSAFWDSGEELTVATYGQSHVLPQIPAEAARICLRATWHSARAH